MKQTCYISHEELCTINNFVVTTCNMITKVTLLSPAFPNFLLSFLNIPKQQITTDQGFIQVTEQEQFVNKTLFIKILCVLEQNLKGLFTLLISANSLCSTLSLQTFIITLTKH